MYLKLSGVGEFARNQKILCAWRRHEVNASANLPAMFPEMIAAQERVAPDLGISPDELRCVQAQMKFAAAENFVRHGYRREASKLFMRNLGGASSISQIVSTAFRLAVPGSLFQWNRRRKQDRAVQRLGSIDEVIKTRSDR
jgi:hypothetical protein